MSVEEVSPKLKEIGVGLQWPCIKTGTRGRKQRILRLAEDGIISIRPKSAHHPAKECSFHRWKKLKYAQIISENCFVIVYTQDDEQRNFESRDYNQIVDKINQCISYFTGRQVNIDTNNTNMNTNTNNNSDDENKDDDNNNDIDSNNKSRNSDDNAVSPKQNNNNETTQEQKVKWSRVFDFVLSLVIFVSFCMCYVTSHTYADSGRNMN